MAAPAGPFSVVDAPRPPPDAVSTRTHVHVSRKLNRSLKLHEFPEIAAEGLTGAVVWEASGMLSSLLENTSFFGEGQWPGKRVVEVGAGLGLCGITCALLGADVTLTDQEKQMGLLERNVALNVPPDLAPGACRCAQLTWGEDVAALGPPFDYILASDLVYERESFVPLVQTLEALSGPDTVALLAYRWRTLQGPDGAVIPPELFIALLEESFDVKRLSNELVSRTVLCDSVRLFRLRKRPAAQGTT